MNWLDKTVDAPGSFRLCKAIYIPDYSRQIDRYRCDSHGWGPVPVNWSHDGDLFGLDSVKNIYDLLNFNVVIDAAPYFYIIYSEISNNDRTQTPQDSPEKQYECWLERPETVAPTLPHLFRMMIEWDYVFHEPFFNSEPSARLSHDALSILGMTPSVRGYFLNNYPDMPVARYLRDDPEAKTSPNDGSMIKSIENYLQKVLADFSQRPAKEDMWNTTIELPSSGHVDFS